MSLRKNPVKKLDYFSNIVDHERATQLHYFSVERLICHLAVQIDGHNLTYHYHCFSCRICRIILTTVLSRGHQKLLQIVKRIII